MTCTSVSGARTAGADTGENVAVRPPGGDWKKRRSFATGRWGPAVVNATMCQNTTDFCDIDPALAVERESTVNRWRIRRLLRFNLRAMLVVMTVLGVLLAWEVRRVKQQRGDCEGGGSEWGRWV